MNPVLAYAIEHQGDAKGLLVSKGVPLDDVEDVVQDALIKLLRADPPHADNPKGYWTLTVITTARTYWRRRRELRLDFDRVDLRQDLESSVSQRETIREAWEGARPFERRAIVEMLTQNGRPLSSKTKTAMCKLRCRLREQVAV